MRRRKFAEQFGCDLNSTGDRGCGDATSEGRCENCPLDRLTREIAHSEEGELVQIATQMCFATDRYSVDWRDEDALSFFSLQTLIAEKNNFEHEQALEQQEEHEQQQRKWQTPL